MASFSISLNELEKRWHNSLEKRATWLNFIVNNLYEILFFFAGLLVVYGFIKIIRKKRNYGDDYDDF
jgi:hypothetical protein